MSENICRFCDIVSGNHSSPENVPVFENKDYFSIASIGALVEGWMLIVPKKHTCSLKEIYQYSSFADYTTTNIKVMQKKYGHLIAFEHGPNKMGSDTSCGTNHAHLHIVPIDGSLINEMNESGMDWEVCRANDISEKVQNCEYLFYCDIPEDGVWNNPIGYLHVLEAPISQFFRRIIAKKLGCETQFDYKKNPNIQITQNTAKVLSDCFASKSL